MNKTIGLRKFSLFFIGIIFFWAACGKEDSNTEPEPDPEPERLNLEIIRGSVEDIDGNIYGTVLIGDQEWMAENLKTTRYNNGNGIDNAADNTDWIGNTSGAYAWYNNAEASKDIYGAVYNWHAVANSSKLCPAGWRVPSDNDWSQLVDFLTVEYSLINDSYYPGSIGNRLKSCRQVRSPLGTGCLTTVNPRWHNHDVHYGFDDFGFSALPIGSRNTEGIFISNSGYYGNWWSATGNGTAEAFIRYINFDAGAIFRRSSTKTNGFAVRCVK